MSNSIRIPAGNFTQPGLPTWVPFSERIGFLPELRAWFSGYSPTVERDQDNRMVRWQSRLGARSQFAKANSQYAGNPLYVQDGYLGRSCLRFTKAHHDALTYTGARLTGAVRQTTIMIADLKPAAAGGQSVLGSIVPDDGWNLIGMTRDDEIGGVFLNTSTGNGGAVGHQDDITIYTNTGRPMLYISVVDAFFNTVKTKINTQPIQISSVTPVIKAPAVNIGWHGFAGDASVFGVDMDLYDLIMLDTDIFADGNQGHLDAIVAYADATYRII